MPREVLRPEKYLCPVCGRPYGELMHTGHLSGHLQLGGDGYTLCRGSRAPIKGLVARPQEARPDGGALDLCPGQGTL